MGLLDFFKKKTKANPNTEGNSNTKSVNNKENLLSNPANKGKSLNEIYAEKQNQSPTINTIFSQQENNYEVVVEVNSTIHGKHGDNFRGLLGYNFLSSAKGHPFLISLVAMASIHPPVLENPFVNIKETDFRGINGNSDVLRVRVVTSNEKTISAFPYLKTDYILPFTTKRIAEWSHVGNMEAEIQGGGRDTFGLSFFATDYAINKRSYKSSKDINIRISAIALVLEKSEVTEINGATLDENFAGYMPNNDLQNPSYYNFIGVLLNFIECRITDSNSGYILKVKLINEESNPDFFTVDMFVNKENIRFSDLKEGMQISGALWFQGELA